jgi:hypothetical protein
MSLGDVVNKLHNQDSLSDSSTAEEANLSSLGVWGQKVDDFDTGDKNFLLDAHLNELWCISVDWGTLICSDWTTLIDWLANDVDDASQCFGSDWDSDG